MHSMTPRRAATLIFAAFFVIAALPSAASGFGDAWASFSQRPDSAKTVDLLLSVQWEGRDLRPINLDAVRAFRRSFTDIRFVHLLSPAYFLGADAASNAKAIKSVMLPGDRVGLLVSGWKSVAEGAGVGFRNGPTMWGHELRAIDCVRDCGQDVPIYIYADSEIERIVAFGANTLRRQGFGDPAALLAAGWLASSPVLTAAARAGIRHDFSVVPPSLLASRAAAFPLYRWVRSMWPTVTPFTQPFPTSTTAGSIVQVPQTLATVDFLAAGQALGILKDFDAEMKRNPGNEMLLHFSFVQETAAQTLPLLAASLQEVFAYASSNAIAIESFELQAAPIPDAVAREAETLRAIAH